MNNQLKYFLYFFVFSLFFSSCSLQKRISLSARQLLLTDTALNKAHVGISVFEPASNKNWYSHQSDKYFIPASNTKIATCYAAMKYLGKNLPGLRYETTPDEVFIQPTGDPTFLHPEFENQRVYNFLKNIDKKIVLNTTQWQDSFWGSGWAWNDYSEAYMAERTAMPIYGNVVRFSQSLQALKVEPEFFSNSIVLDSTKDMALPPLNVERKLAANQFFVQGGGKLGSRVETPFYTNNSELIYLLLSDTLHREVYRNGSRYEGKNTNASVIHSGPTDSLLKPMMHRSDNFFAEQVLLMVSNQQLGIMNAGRMIDTLLKTDLKELPHVPRWADASGLSRYNLFTPQDLVVILNKMRTEFGAERIQEIFPTGGEGTLSSYYTTEAGYLYAKTGTLSGVVALSGYLYTKKQKTLIFSVLVNNHYGSATAVRRAIEKFLTGIRNKY
jgi:serine-type D-Ala-D-Ala carboxypeptidase/endopeptidase (penicillin-binding protein 4)